MMDSMAAAPAPLWIFAYGSLMWRPGFPYAERERATLAGHHRALCIWSHHWRGTAAVPGLVFGLDRGGACTGVAYRIAPEDSDAVLGAVRERELVTDVYLETLAPAVLADGRTVEAVAYLADPAHAQYAGRLSRDAILRAVTAATGVAGPNRAYVLNTQAHLADLGVEDPELTALCAALAPAGADS